MLKTQALRDVILRSVPALAEHPERLVITITQGRIEPFGSHTLAFTEHYTIEIIVLDYDQHKDTLLYPILLWLKTHQPDLFDNPEKRKKAIRYEAVLNNHMSADIEIAIDLTESVAVRPHPQRTGAMILEHRDEPPPALHETRPTQVWLKPPHDDEVYLGEYNT